LPVQVVGAISIQIHIKVSHEDWCISSGWVLIESILYMGVEIIETWLTWQKVSSNNRDLSDTGAVQTTHAVIAMPTHIFQVIIRFDDAIASWSIDGKSNSTLLLRVCLSANDLVSFKILGMDHTVTVRITLLPSKSGASKKRKSNTHVPHIQESLL